MSEFQIRVRTERGEEHLFTATRGEKLQHVLSQTDMDFPCGGHGSCARCRIRLIEGELAPSSREEEVFKPEDLD
ncbi:MAG: hypothetical protein D6820_05025, partial [Lentisphaerae bacterium]